MNYSTEKDDYLMTTPYTKKIQQKYQSFKIPLQSKDSEGNTIIKVSYESIM